MGEHLGKGGNVLMTGAQDLLGTSFTSPSPPALGSGQSSSEILGKGAVQAEAPGLEEGFWGGQEVLLGWSWRAGAQVPWAGVGAVLKPYLLGVIFLRVVLQEYI